MTVIAMVGCVFTSLLAAYAFSRLKFRRSLLVLLCHDDNDDSVAGHGRAAVYYPEKAEPDRYEDSVILPWFFGAAFFIFMLVQFFRGIPGELDEAAEIDGCGKIAILFRILVPVVKPAIDDSFDLRVLLDLAGLLPAADLYEYDGNSRSRWR